MATDVTVVIAYRDMGCPHRRRSFAYMHGWYAGLATGWQLDLGWGVNIHVEAGTDDATFTRASAINAGVRATASRIIIQTDPDTLVNPMYLRKAVQLAAEHNGLVFPHNRYVRLGAVATDDYLSGRRTLWSMSPPDYEGPAGHGSGPDSPGGTVVFSRRTWELARGFDERFGLWGGDDAAFAYAAAALTTNHRRTGGDVTHLWHPRLPQSEIGSPAYVDQFAILAQYRDAAALGPQHVRDLVATR